MSNMFAYAAQRLNAGLDHELRAGFALVEALNTCKRKGGWPCERRADDGTQA
jgi:hypothetical protein